MGMLLYMMEMEMAQKADKGVAKKVAPSPPKKEEKKPAQSLEDIKKMSGPKIRKFAKENGVENPEEYTVSELKAILCEKFS